MPRNGLGFVRDGIGPHTHAYATWDGIPPHPSTPSNWWIIGEASPVVVAEDRRRPQRGAGQVPNAHGDALVEAAGVLRTVPPGIGLIAPRSRVSRPGGESGRNMAGRFRSPLPALGGNRNRAYVDPEICVNRRRAGQGLELGPSGRPEIPTTAYNRFYNRTGVFRCLQPP
jgi:hypothetical protein